MDFVPIRVSTLRTFVPYQFDIFIKINGRYIKYLQKGDDVENSRLGSLRTKNVRQLFIADSDEESYQHFLDDSLSALASDPKLNADQKAEAVSGVAAGAIEDYHEDPESIASFKMVERASTGIMNVVGKNSDVLVQFYKKVHESDSDLIFRNAISIAALTACMAEQMSIPESEASNMALAAMVCDIGMVRMSEYKHLFSKNTKEFTGEDWSHYKNHPNLSCQILNGKNYINPRILELVKTHEERRSGEGFPQGKVSLDQSQEIIGLCGCYDRFVTIYGMSHKDSLQELSVNQLGNFDLKLIQSFKSMMVKQGFLSK